MATILQIKGADFSGLGLPIITPLYEDGLAAAFRPGGSAANTLDLSGNGKKASVVGAPVWYENYVECDYANGLSVNLIEDASFTFAVVAKTVAVDGALASFLGGTYTGGRGFSMTRGATAFNFQTFAKKTADGTYQNVLRPIATQDMINANESNWDMWFISVDAEKNKLAMYSTCGTYQEYDGAANGLNFADRDGLNRALHIGKPAYNTAATCKAKTLVAEALYYSKALTSQEMGKIVAISRKAMALRGIVF